MFRILVVDDDEPTQRLLDLIFLEHSEYDIRHVGKASEGLSELRTQAPDLLMLDLHLPDMDGPTLYRQARSDGYEGPVLILTASSAGDPLLDQFASEGGVAIMRKPFDIDELAALVASALAEA